MPEPYTAPSRALVWDLPVRVMHWTLVLAVVGAWATQELEGDWFKYHVWCGYAVLLLVLTRVAWGFLGTRHARFTSFVRGPGAVFGYARAMLRREPAMRSATGTRSPGLRPVIIGRIRLSCLTKR